MKKEIIVNDKKIPLCDTLLLLLLKFVVELKKDKKGWISMQSLYEKRIIHYPVRYQIFNHLRTAFKGNLLEKNPMKFIENKGSGYYRISTHPDFVTYDKKKLLKHPEIDQRAFKNNEKKKKPEDREGVELTEIRKVAKDLPDNCFKTD